MKRLVMRATFPLRTGSLYPLLNYYLQPRGMDGLMPKPHYPSIKSTGRDLTFDLIYCFILGEGVMPKLFIRPGDREDQ